LTIHIHTFFSDAHNLCLLSGGLGLGAPDLGGLAFLYGALAPADGGGLGDGVLAEVGTVVALGGRVDNGGVGPAIVSRMFRLQVVSCISTKGAVDRG
jgi:hypothetical protein